MREEQLMKQGKVVDLGAVAWHIHKRKEMEELGMASMQIFLDTKNFQLLSINRNPDEIRAFESWSEWTREEHAELIARVEKNPSVFIEIPLMPDDYAGDYELSGDYLAAKVEWLTEKAAERGVELVVMRT